MEKATLLVSINKKGKTIGQLEFENGKRMTLGQQFSITTDMNKKEVEVRREKGLIVEVRLNGKDLSSKAQNTQHVMSRNRINSAQTSRPVGKTNSSQNNRPVNRMNNTQPAGSARAPYNFVQLNHTVVPAEFSDIDGLKQFLGGQKEKYSGHLQLKLETRTPLYIRDTVDYEQYVKQKNEDQKENPDFFSPGSQIKIPGSGIRGMVRNLVEIMSWSKFGSVDNRLLYYRGLADKSSLRKEYQRNMSSFDRNTRRTSYLFYAGYLKKIGFDYLIIPAKKIDGKSFYQVRKSGKEEFSFSKQSDGKYIVVSGNMPNKKYDWIINPPDFEKPPINIPEIDVINYINDANRFQDKSTDNNARKRDGNLLRMLQVSNDGIVPCFYVRWKDENEKERVSFGHTGYFRLAYKLSVKKHIPKKLLEENFLDLTTALFGKESQFASRIFFEDAKLAPGQGDVLMGELSPKILSGPKPTTFQHYLKQSNGVKTPITSLSHWNSDDAEIRGNKLYWHRNINRNSEFWREEGPIAAGDTQHTVINPVRPGVVFDGKIRFENLSPVELGALLFALDLPENCFHKLGMGKPLGLGSVHIQVRLFIKDLKKRYERLFDVDKWQTGICEEKNLANLKTAFENHVLEHLKEHSSKSLWQTKRLEQLRTLLDWSNTDKLGWLEKTQYMELNEFRNRKVLPEPEEIK